MKKFSTEEITNIISNETKYLGTIQTKYEECGRKN